MRVFANVHVRMLILRTLTLCCLTFIGAPIQLFPDADKPGIGENPKENNRFDYSEVGVDDDVIVRACITLINLSQYLPYHRLRSMIKPTVHSQHTFERQTRAQILQSSCYTPALVYDNV